MCWFLIQSLCVLFIIISWVFPCTSDYDFRSVQFTLKENSLFPMHFTWDFQIKAFLFIYLNFSFLYTFQKWNVKVKTLVSFQLQKCVSKETIFPNTRHCGLMAQLFYTLCSYGIVFHSIVKNIFIFELIKIWSLHHIYITKSAHDFTCIWVTFNC